MKFFKDDVVEIVSGETRETLKAERSLGYYKNCGLPLPIVGQRFTVFAVHALGYDPTELSYYKFGWHVYEHNCMLYYRPIKNWIKLILNIKK